MRAATDSSRACGTYAVGGMGHYAHATASKEELRATLAAATGSHALWDELARGHSGSVLPALARHLEDTQKELQAYAASEGYVLDPVKLAHRALGQLDTEMVIASLRRGATVAVTDKAWREALSHAHHQAMGVAPVDMRPAAWDWRGLVGQLGYSGPKRTKATSHFPYPPRARPAGSAGVLDPAGILRELERLDGPVAEDDHQVWLALDELYAHAPNVKPTLAPLLAEAAARGQPLIFSPADKAHVDTPMDEQFARETIPKRVAMGVLEEVTKEQACRPGNVISQLKCAVKGELTKSEAEKALVDAKDLKGIAAAAQVRAAGMVARTLQLMNDKTAPLAPADAAEAAHAAEMEAPVLRMCHSGRGLSEHLEVGSFRLPTSTHLLETAAPDTFMFCADMSNWYFTAMTSTLSLFLHYVTWKGRYFLQHRMSMGLSPSAVVASIASAFIV